MKLKDLFNVDGEFRNFGCNGANGVDSMCSKFTEKTGIVSIGPDNTVGYNAMGERRSRYPSPNFTDSDGKVISGVCWKHTRDSSGAVQRENVTSDHEDIPFPQR